MDDIEYDIVWSADSTDLVNVIDVDSMTAHDCAITKVTALIDGQVQIFTGSAIRFHGNETTPGDRGDAKIGELLATARAFEDLARGLTRRANGRMAHLEHIREMRPAQLEKSREWHQARSVAEAAIREKAQSGQIPTESLTEMMAQMVRQNNYSPKPEKPFIPENHELTRRIAKSAMPAVKQAQARSRAADCI